MQVGVEVEPSPLLLSSTLTLSPSTLPPSPFPVLVPACAHVRCVAFAEQELLALLQSLRRILASMFWSQLLLLTT
jgi:hypothetical protein